MSAIVQVLHLEDNPQDVELILEKLSADGILCGVTVARDRAGFETALMSRKFDIILCDYNLPDYDGLAALQLARESQPATPVILISGSLGEEEAVKSLQMGATDYLVKQHLERVAPAVRRALDEAVRLRRHHAAVESLRESEMRFRQLAESVDDIFWMRGKDAGGFLYVSPAYETIWGRSLESLYASPLQWWDGIHPEDRVRVSQAVLARPLDGGYEVEYRIVRPDGKVRWVLDRAFPVYDDAGVVYRIAGITKDVTERKQAEKTLHEQAEMLDLARDGIVITDPNMRIIYWNRGADRLLGWSKEEVLGRSAADYMTPNDVEQIQALREAADQQGEAEGELCLHTKAGATLWVQARTIFARDEKGQIRARISFFSDATEKKQMQERLDRAQHLESLGMLAAGIAHDFNNILAPIGMGTSLLEAQVKEESGRRILEIVAKSATRGAALVAQLLSFARGASGEVQVLQLRHVLKDVADMAEATFPKSIRVKSHLARHLRPISGNATQLHRVFLNLSVNARDAMPEGGELKINADNRAIDASAASAIVGGKPGNFVVVEVSDTGSGIPPDVLSRIWEPFFTTKGPEKGTGLGLATVRGILQNHGGFIALQTQPGRGTTFTVYLPAVAAQADGSESSATD